MIAVELQKKDALGVIPAYSEIKWGIFLTINTYLLL